MHESQVLGRGNARRRDALGTAGVWVERDDSPTSIRRVRHQAVREFPRAIYFRFAATRVFGIASPSARRASARTRFR